MCFMTKRKGCHSAGSTRILPLGIWEPTPLKLFPKPQYAHFWPGTPLLPSLGRTVLDLVPTFLPLMTPHLTDASSLHSCLVGSEIHFEEGAEGLNMRCEGKGSQR